MPKMKQKVIPSYEPFELTNEELSILEPHKLTEFIPKMTSKEITTLFDSIKENGFIDNIIITNDYKIIDGRTRVDIAKMYKKYKPKFIFFNGNDNEIFDFIFNKNLNRRQLNIGQKTLIALKLFGSNSNCEQLANDYFGVNSASIGRAVYIQQNNPDIIKNIFDGKLTLDNAFMITKTAIKKNNPIIQNSYKGHSYMSTATTNTSNDVKETFNKISQMFTDMLTTQQQQNAEFANKLNDMFGSLMEEYDKKNNPQKNIVNIYKDQFGMHNDYELANLLNVKTDVIENWKIENSIPNNKIKQLDSILQIRMMDSVENDKNPTNKIISNIEKTINCDIIEDVKNPDDMSDYLSRALKSKKIKNKDESSDNNFPAKSSDIKIVYEYLNKVFSILNIDSKRDLSKILSISATNINNWLSTNRIPQKHVDNINKLISMASAQMYYENIDVDDYITNFMKAFNIKNRAELGRKLDVTMQMVGTWKRYKRIPKYVKDVMDSMLNK